MPETAVLELSAIAETGIGKCAARLGEHAPAELAFARAAALFDRLAPTAQGDQRGLAARAQLAFDRAISAIARSDADAAIEQFGAAAEFWLAVCRSGDGNADAWLQFARTRSRECLLLLFEDVPHAAARAEPTIETLDTIESTLTAKLEVLPGFARHRAVLSFVLAVAKLRDGDHDGALAVLDAVTERLPAEENGEESEWLAVVRIALHTTALRLRLDDVAARATHVEAIDRALAALDQEEPPFSDLRHVLARLLDGLESVAAELPPTQRDALASRIAPVRRRVS